jgi:hypothetical protein
MSLRRLAAIVLSAAVALLVAVVLYLAFGNLSQHKGRIEALVTDLLGRPFAIDGAFELQVLPSISVVAERVRLGNADWGSQPQMVEIGRVSVQVGLWSLVSGPVDVRSFELSDVSVLLETNADGKGNWVFGEARAPAPAAEPLAESGAAVPLVIRSGKLGNVRITYRERGKADRVALIETLSIGPGSDGLLAISGKGSLNEFPAKVSGELGPLDALTSGRDIRMAIQAAVGALEVDVKGGLGRLDPLDGADLAVRVAHPDLGTMLKKLQLPVVLAGPLIADVRLTDAGDLTQLDLAAKLGDITVKIGGTLRALGLPGSDLRIEASVGDAARLAGAFGVTGLPVGALEVDGRIASSRTEIKLDGVSARFAGARAKVSGTVRLAREPSTDLRFEFASESLSRLRQGLPEISLAMSGDYASSRDKLEVKNLKGRIGETEISGWVSMVGTGRKHVEIELASPRLDLTPFLAQGTGAKSADDAHSKPKPTPKKAERKFVFDDTPLPLGKPLPVDASVHFTLAEVRLGTEVLRDVDGTLRVDGGQLTLVGSVRDNLEGTISGAVKLAPADGGAELGISVSAKNMRPSLPEIDPRDAPLTNVEASLRVRGASARQMASLANGRILVTQSAGKLKSGVIGLFGGTLFRELAGKLNPFAAQDPYLQLECTVVRADIVDGQVTVNPVLMQSDKVTIVAGGKIDLGTEALDFQFNTRPRTGVGVSAGMFTNPFIEVAGTLTSPKLGVGTKAALSGAAAVATGGLSLLGQGILDRARGSKDLCKETLDEAAGKAK